MSFRSIAVIAASAALVASARTSSEVEFTRDVQPILREHCVSCHGPDLQMGGLRLDRRADALRGGTQSDIGPGNADGSRLYHRLTGTTFGQQMPPTGPLTDAQIEIIKTWIDEGAEWPDDAAGEVVAPPVDAEAARLIAAIRGGDRAAIDAMLGSNPRSVQRRGPHGQTPLMAAALYGDASLVKRLLTLGPGEAGPNATNTTGATALMWAAPDPAKMQLLLDAGADVNARSDEGRSALTITSGIVGAAPGLRMLLEYGADVTIARASDASPMREANRINAADMAALLREYGAPAFINRPGTKIDSTSTAPVYDPGRLAMPTPLGAMPASLPNIRAAVERSVPLLQDVGIAFLKQTGCASCHHNSVVSVAVAAARANGFTVNEALVRQQAEAIGAYLETWRERAVQNIPIAGGADTMSYLLLGLAADHYPPDPITDAQALWIKRRQAADGHWPIGSNRPPIESNDIEVTAVSMRALQKFAPPTLKNEFAQAVDRARAWLTTAKATETEERAFRLLGLSWANAPQDAIKKAVGELLAAQRDDGGWPQRERMGSDAYGTGEALVALRESGALGLNDRNYKRGIEFLLRTQVDDGSWFVESRATPIQAYFESSFPYGRSQWVSAAATAWATTALAMTK